jgi:hypothetical protein
MERGRKQLTRLYMEEGHLSYFVEWESAKHVAIPQILEVIVIPVP